MITLLLLLLRKSKSWNRNKTKAGLKRVTLELGSNAAVIIDEDVELADEIIERVKWGAFVNNGQVCISVQRVFVHETKIHEFLSKLESDGISCCW